MADSTPVTVILPTTGWTAVCEQVREQLRPGDELLVVCDSHESSVADRVAETDRCRLVVAGEPEGCSGKANAIAAGMAAAETDRLVWTDDDFCHPPDWLAGLVADYERQGPTSELPVFVGEDPLARFLEPIYAISATLSVYLADIPWAGSVIFERSDLTDETAFLAALRRSVSDDGLLGEHIDVTTVARTRRVGIGGSIRETLENQVRFTKISWYHAPRQTIVQLGLTTTIAIGGLLAPILTALLTTTLMGFVYAAFGIRRSTMLFAYPLILAGPLLAAYGLARRSFVWHGRRYRWHGKFDVTVASDR